MNEMDPASGVGIIMSNYNVVWLSFFFYTVSLSH